MGTVRQVELLRTEVGEILQSGLKELRAGSEALRSELLGAVRTGMDANREELQRALAREQRELAQAHKDIRDLRRQLDEARTAQTTAETVAAARPPAIGNEGVTEELPSRGPVFGAAADGTPSLPDAAAAASIPGLTNASAPPLKETSVPAYAPRNEPVQDSGRDGRPGGQSQAEHPRTAPGPQEQLAAQVDAEFAAAARDLSAGGKPSPDEAGSASRPRNEETAAEPAPAGRPENHNLFDTLYKAASISAANVVCHPHTWQFIAGCAAAAGHFQLPVATTHKDRDDLITIEISGRSLVAVVNSLYTTYTEASRTGDLETRALSLGHYIEFAHEIGTTRPVFSRYEGAETDPEDRPRTRIILDRRPDLSA